MYNKVMVTGKNVKLTINGQEVKFAPYEISPQDRLKHFLFKLKIKSAKTTDTVYVTSGTGYVGPYYIWDPSMTVTIYNVGDGNGPADPANA